MLTALFLYFDLTFCAQQMQMMVQQKRDSLEAIAKQHDKLFLGKDEVFLKKGDVGSAKDWSQKKEESNYWKMKNLFVTSFRRILQSKELQGRHRLYTTIDDAEEAEDAPERSDWSFRKLYPSLQAAIKEYEDEIEIENKEVEAYRNTVKEAIDMLETAPFKLGSALEKLSEIQSAIQVQKNYYRSLTPEEKEQEKESILGIVKPLINEEIFQKLEVENLEKIAKDPEVYELSVQDKERNLMFMERDALKQIEKIQKRIDFIKAHPHLFVLEHRDHYDVQGVIFSENGGIKYLDPVVGDEISIEKPGAGSVVTVVDSNQLQQSSEPIHPALRAKMTNPDDNCYCVVDHMQQGSHSHATFVASIIALDKQRIGLAPHSKIQLLSIERAKALSSVSYDSRGEEQGQVYDEAYYYEMLDAFGRGVRKFRVADKISILCKNASSVKECLPHIDGNIINLSIGFQNLGRFSALSKEKSEMDPEKAFFWWHQLAKERKLLVKASGNQALKAGSGFMYRFMKVFASHPTTRDHFIMVCNLNVDGLHPNPTSVLPGKHAGLQNRTICAIGTEIKGLVNSPQDHVTITKKDGTSFATPFVSALAAIIESRFPELAMAEIADCILDSATPIILVGAVKSFLDPVALDTMSHDFQRPGTYKDMNGKKHKVTQKMLEESWETYGHGRVNVARALELASLLNWAKKQDELEWAVYQRDYDEMERVLDLHSLV